MAMPNAGANNGGLWMLQKKLRHTTKEISVNWIRVIVKAHYIRRGAGQ
jgi:hypothetical protein